MKLQKDTSMAIDNKFYILKNGNITITKIFNNGKVILSNYLFGTDEIFGNFFLLTPEIQTPDFYIEIYANEDSVLEEICIEKIDKLKNLSIYEKIILQLLKKNLLELLFKLYSKEKYILFFIKLFSNKNGIVLKKDISYELSGISRSQFYLLYSDLKSKGFFIEKEKKIFLNIEKIDNYLFED